MSSCSSVVCVHVRTQAAIKDGFAVAAGTPMDTSRARDVVGASRAGAAVDGTPALAADQTAYVTTGAPMPAGTDAVVQIEWARAHPAGGAAAICA